jgi:hypothetical protein
MRLEADWFPFKMASRHTFLAMAWIVNEFLIAEEGLFVFGKQKLASAVNTGQNPVSKLHS